MTVDYDVAPPAAITLLSIHGAVEAVCQAANRKQPIWTLRPATPLDFNAFLSKEQTGKDEDKQPLSIAREVDTTRLFGIVTKTNNKDESTLTTFYLAYSTWDGRFLYLDHLGLFRDERDEQENRGVALERLLRSTLASVAVELQCSRYTWQHYQHPEVWVTQKTTTATDSLLESLPAPPEPETMHGWLTLQWSASQMNKFLGNVEQEDQTPSQLSETKVHPSNRTMAQVRKVIENVLKEQSTSSSSSSTSLALCLAGAEDVDAIGRLVHGLALYENELDAVHVTVDHYRCDGGFDSQPNGENNNNNEDVAKNQPLGLFFCLLLVDNDHDQEKHAVGMAFCYLGYKLKEGPFIYLEDLFVEESHRGRGGGSLVMRTLARLGLALDCSQLVWQALDWNAPALGFYNKIGARVMEGRLTSRYAGSALVEFHRLCNRTTAATDAQDTE